MQSAWIELGNNESRKELIIKLCVSALSVQAFVCVCMQCRPRVARARACMLCGGGAGRRLQRRVRYIVATIGVYIVFEGWGETVCCRTLLV